MTGYGSSTSGDGKNKINAELKALNGKFFELKIRGLDINFNLSKTIKDYLFKTLNRGSVYLYLESSKISQQDNVSLNSAKFELLNDIVEQVNKKYKKSLNLNHLLRINDFKVGKKKTKRTGIMKNENSNSKIFLNEKSFKK